MANYNIMMYLYSEFTERLEQPYYKNYSKVRLAVHNVVMNNIFDLTVALIIFLNVITMALEFYLMPVVSEPCPI